jgi:hypothetical protein
LPLLPVIGTRPRVRTGATAAVKISQPPPPEEIFSACGRHNFWLQGDCTFFPAAIFSAKKL